MDYQFSQAGFSKKHKNFAVSSGIFFQRGPGTVPGFPVFSRRLFEELFERLRKMEPVRKARFLRDFLDRPVRVEQQELSVIHPLRHPVVSRRDTNLFLERVQKMVIRHRDLFGDFRQRKILFRIVQQTERMFDPRIELLRPLRFQFTQPGQIPEQQRIHVQRYRFEFGFIPFPGFLQKIQFICRGKADRLSQCRTGRPVKMHEQLGKRLLRPGFKRNIWRHEHYELRIQLQLPVRKYQVRTLRRAPVKPPERTDPVRMIPTVRGKILRISTINNIGLRMRHFPEKTIDFPNF